MVETYLVIQLMTMTTHNFSFEFSNEDVGALRRIYIGFGEIDSRPAIMKSLSLGMAKIIRKGKSNLLSSNGEKTGNLKRSFRKKTITKFVSAYGGFKRGKGGGNHAHLIDRGTVDRYQKSTGRYTGSISAKNPRSGSMFWTRAVEETGPDALKHTMNVVYRELEKIIDERHNR